MRIKELLAIQRIIDGREIPYDLNREKLPIYYSKSKDTYLNILDIDLIHVLRVLTKTLEENEGLREENCELQSESAPPDVIEKIWTLIENEKKGENK